MNEQKTESGIVVLSKSNDDQALRLQIVKMLVETSVLTAEGVVENAKKLVSYVKDGQ